MLFKNKIEYTKGLFLEIYRTEMKKVLLVLRIITRDDCDLLPKGETIARLLRVK